MQKVPELRMALEKVFNRKWINCVTASVEQRVFGSLAPGPGEDLAFYRTGDREGEVSLPDLHFLGTQELQEEAERLLRDVLLRQRWLITRDAADGLMQHGDKRENEHTLDECGPGGKHPE
jgi:hypothetical protein